MWHQAFFLQNFTKLREYFVYTKKSKFTSSHLHIVIEYISAYLACCHKQMNLFPPPPPLQVRKGTVVSVEKGWRRYTRKLSRDRGESAVYIHMPLILLNGLITDCASLVSVRLIIWTCSSQTFLITHYITTLSNNLSPPCHPGTILESITYVNNVCCSVSDHMRIDCLRCLHFDLNVNNVSTYVQVLWVWNNMRVSN